MFITPATPLPVQTRAESHNDAEGGNVRQPGIADAALWHSHDSLDDGGIRVSEIQIDEAVIGLVRPIELPPDVSDIWKQYYLDAVYRWLPVADATYQDWPERPNCGHFFGGAYWYGLETGYTTLVYAVARGAAEILGVTPSVAADTLLQRAVGAIRYLGFTHESGPPECVRVQSKSRWSSGCKWGGITPGIDWMSRFFMSSQTGGTVVAMGLAAWLLWEHLDEETRQLAANVAAWYADRWCEEEPRVGTYHNTQTEENGWTAHGMAFAACFLHGHPRAEKWRQAADWWTANICVTPYDCRRNTDLLQGKEVRSWTVGATTHPDFTAENHDFVHPNYMASGLRYATSMALMHHLAGLEVPEVLRFNRQPLYNTLKRMAEDDGLLAAIQSQDWWYLNHYGDTMSHAGMSVLLNDCHAAYLERRCLEQGKRIMDGLPGGHLYTPDPESYRLNSEQTMRGAERGAMMGYAEAFLLHWVLGDGAQPCSEAEFKAWQRGVHVFPHGGFILRKADRTTAGFSWRNRPVVFVQPEEGSWLITPHSHSLSGSYVCDPRPEFPGGGRKRRYSVNEDGIGFSAAVQWEREEGRILQNIALVVPDDEVAFFFDRTVAEQSVRVLEQRSGEIGVRNEDYSQLRQLAPGRRTLYTQGTEFTAISAVSQHDEWFRTDRAGWANLDDAVGYVIFGSKGLAYQAKHVYPKYTGMEDFLILSYDNQAHDYAPGDVISGLAVAIHPNQQASQTASRAETVVRALGRDLVDALLTPAYLAVFNIADAPRTCALQFDMGGWETLPVPDGCTVIWDGSYTCQATLPNFSADYRRCRLHISADAHWEATVAPSGRIFIRSLGGSPVETGLTVEGESRTISLQPGEVIEV